MASKIHVGDIGTVFRLTITEDGAAVDVSLATTKQIKFLAPNGTLLTKTATFTTDGTDGQIEYATVADDLSLPGKWQIQAHVAISGWDGHSEALTFTVYSVIGG